MDPQRPPFPTTVTPRRPRLRLLALALACMTSCALAAQAARDEEVLDVTQRPFEELLNTEIITAAKLAHQISGASSAVAIVTAKDIQAYGHRTLDDILSSMRGLHMAHDFNYGYLGGRGYSDPFDYAGRITLLIDGYSAADGYFGQSYFGQDGLLDVELIERVEFIPGTGSSDYGGGAFLGVINIITKRGADIQGTQVAVDLASHRTHKQRVTWGQRLDNGADLLLSASSYRSAGRLITVDPAQGIQERVENESNKRLFLKGSFEGWTLTSALAQRPIRYPENGETDSDTSGFVSLRYDTELRPQLKLSSHAYAGQYLYRSTTPETMDIGTGRWWGLDTKVVSTALAQHTLVLGAEYRNDWRQGRRIVEPNYTFDHDVSRKTLSIYAYDDISLNNATQLNLGLRHERRNNNTQFTSPRAALIFNPQPGSTFKLSTGMAHRQPTASLESYADLAYRIEQVKTREIVWEQSLGPATRLTSSVYHYNISQRMEAVEGGGTLTAQGAEVELERHWPGDMRLRGSYAWQLAHNHAGQRPVNSPKHNAKLMFTTPLVGERLRLGLELQYLGQRPGYGGLHLPSTTVAHITLTSRNWWPHWQFSLSVRNAFNRKYEDVLASGGGLTAFPRDGRSLWLQVSREFP